MQQLLYRPLRWTHTAHYTLSVQPAEEETYKINKTEIQAKTKTNIIQSIARKPHNLSSVTKKLKTTTKKHQLRLNTRTWALSVSTWYRWLTWRTPSGNVGIWQLTRDGGIAGKWAKVGEKILSWKTVYWFIGSFTSSHVGLCKCKCPARTSVILLVPVSWQ